MNKHPDDLLADIDTVIEACLGYDAGEGLPLYVNALPPTTDADIERLLVQEAGA